MFDLSNFNDSQKQAICYSAEAPLLLIAGPGSGKTFTILNRLYYLIHYLKMDSSRMVVITFTKAAAGELKDRFRSLYSDNAQDSFKGFIGTFHSFFYFLLLKSQAIKPNHFLKQHEKYKLLKECIDDVLALKFHDESISSSDISAILNSFSLYKNTLSRDMLYKGHSDMIKNCIYELYLKYEQKRKEIEKYDFDDLQLDCFEYLKSHKRELELWKNSIQVLCVDEFQDINRIQYEIVKLFMNPKIKILAVGDDDQSIYGFRGSDPGFMKHFEEECGANCIYLTQNYRSTGQIVNFATKIISGNTNRYEKTFSAIQGPGNEDIRIMECLNKYDQYQKHYESFASKKGSKVILFRTNMELGKAAAYLKTQNYNIIVKENTDMDFSFIIKDITDYMLFIYQNDSEALLRIINKPMRYVKRETIEMAYGECHCNNAEQILERMMAFSDVRVKERLNQLLLQKKSAQKMGMSACFLFIRLRMGYDSFLKEGKNNDLQEDYKEVLDAYAKKVKQALTLQDILQGPAGEVKTTREYKTDSVELCTLHSSKGLEYDHVWIVDCNEGNLPHGSMLQPDFGIRELEEERRLFYVGITRAKKSLMLSYIKESKENIRPVSRFIIDVNKS